MAHLPVHEIERVPAFVDGRARKASQPGAAAAGVVRGQQLLLDGCRRRLPGCHDGADVLAGQAAEELQSEAVGVDGVGDSHVAPIGGPYGRPHHLSPPCWPRPGASSRTGPGSRRPAAPR